LQRKTVRLSQLDSQILDVLYVSVEIGSWFLVPIRLCRGSLSISFGGIPLLWRCTFH